MYVSLFTCISAVTYLLSLRINLLFLQARCCKRWLLIGECVLLLLGLVFQFQSWHWRYLAAVSPSRFPKPVSWLGETTLRWPILCWVGRKPQVNQSIHSFIALLSRGWPSHWKLPKPVQIIANIHSGNLTPKESEAPEKAIKHKLKLLVVVVTQWVTQNRSFWHVRWNKTKTHFTLKKSKIYILRPRGQTAHTDQQRN